MKTMNKIMMLAACMLLSLGLFAQDKKSEPSKDVMKITLNDSTDIEVSVAGLKPEQREELKKFITEMAKMAQSMNSNGMNMQVFDENGGFEFSFDLNTDSLEQNIESWAKNMEQFAVDMEKFGEDMEKMGVEIEQSMEMKDSTTAKGNWKISFGEDGLSIEQDAGGDQIVEFEFDEDKEEEKDPGFFETKGMFDLGLGFSTLLNTGHLISDESNGYSLKTWGSNVFDLNWSFKTHVGKKGPVYLKYGLGLNFNTYELDGNKFIVEGKNAVTFAEIPTGMNMKKAKFSTTNITVPLMVMFDFDKDGEEEKFNIGFGGFVGYRVGSSAKRKYTNAVGNKVKEVEKGSFHMTDFQYGIQAQIGVGGVNLFARYNLNNLFNDGVNTDVNAVGFGIVL